MTPITMMSKHDPSNQFDDNEEPNLTVLGEIMLILFLTIVVSTSLNLHILRSTSIAGTDSEEKWDEDAQQLTVGPGKSLLLDGSPIKLEALEDLDNAQSVTLATESDTDFEFYFEVRMILQERGVSYAESHTNDSPKSP